MERTTRDVASEILSIIQNLDEEEDAREYVRLYLLALQNAGWKGSIEQVIKEVHDVDVRI